MGNIYRDTLAVDGIGGVISILVEQAIKESCCLVPSGHNDTRDCAVVLFEDGTLDTRMLGNGEHFRNADVLCLVKNWCAWEMIPDTREMIAENDKAQSIIVSAAKSQAKQDEDDDAITTLSDWSRAYSYVDVIPDDARELLAQDYLDWYMTDCQEHVSEKATEAIERLEELAKDVEESEGQ